MMRKRIYDAVEAIAHLIGMWSHLREHIVEAIQEEQDPSDLQFMYNQVYNKRREIMTKTEQALSINWTWHCPLKHSIAIFGYLNELEDADPELFKWDSTFGTELVNMTLSKSTWNEMEFCSRCLWDLLTNEKTDVM